MQDEAGSTAGTLVETRLREAGLGGTTSQRWRRNPAWRARGGVGLDPTSSSCGWPRGLQPRRRVYLTALPLVAATLTRDPLPVSAVMFAEWLPWLLLGLLARALLDRWERRRVMWMVDAARLVVVGSFAAAVLAGWAAAVLGGSDTTATSGSWLTGGRTPRVLRWPGRRTLRR